MDVRTLRYFVLVAEEGSIHGGARRAMVAQPAVSVAVRKLERDLGGALFDRSPHGVELTSAGSALLPHARRILRSVEQARADVHRGMRPGPAPFTVGLTAGRVAAGELTGPILDAFRRSNPDVLMRVRELDFAEQFDAVLEGDVDVALVRSPYEHDALCMEPLFSEPTVLVASPEHPLADLAEVSLEALLPERFLEVVRTPRVWREFWNLAGMRDESARSIPSQAVGLLDFSIDVMRNATVSPMAQSGWRLGGLGGPSLSAVRIPDAPHSVIGVGYRRGDDRGTLASFIATARAVTEELVTIVPGAELAARP
jgi:DNA-binding transcriptional LysR family regulator